MRHCQTLESFIDQTLTQYVPGAFLSGRLACSPWDVDSIAVDFFDPRDVYDADDRSGAPANDAVADNVRSIYRDNDCPPPAAAA